MMRPSKVFITIMDLSFFIWHRDRSRQCLKDALVIYEKSTSNHMAMMSAVTEACKTMRLGTDDEKRALRAKIGQIVLAHRLSESRGLDKIIPLIYYEQQQFTRAIRSKVAEE
ncbi:hypothetical protein HWV62_17930 [Athelia sp. TMB]|nr:hypothetical protein HWV62_17930 [Athelia sp. TMB]